MDMLNLSPNERLDLADLTYATVTSQIGLVQQICGQVLMNPAAAQPAFVLSGFGLTNPSGNQVTVTRGVAMLPYRQGAQVTYGLVSCEGPTSQTIDLSSRGAGTYTVYVSFSYQPGALDTRTLWTPDNGGAEYSASEPTRLVAGWQVNISTVNPGAEWLALGTVAVPSMAIVDQRPLYFEGRPDQSFVPAWGSASTDRSIARGTYGIGDLQTFVQAVQQCLIDIKGPGIANWYTGFVAGQTIGFAGGAKAASTAWLDNNFYTQGNATNPKTVFSADGSAFGYQRSNNAFNFTNGTAATATNVSFSAPGTTAGATGPFSLKTTATTFALADNTQATQPLLYTSASETLDLSAGSLNTLILPPPGQVKYPATQTLNQYINLLDGTILSGLVFYPSAGFNGTNYTYTVGSVTYTEIDGALNFGFPSGVAQNAIGATWIVPLTVPAPCTLTGLTIGTYADGTINGTLALLRKDNSNTNALYSSGASPNVSTTPTSRIAYVSAAGQQVTFSGGTSGITTWGYGTRTVALSEPVAVGDNYTYFLQLDLAQAGAATTSADTATSYRFRLNSIAVTYTTTGPTLMRHG
jgi:hypothetical protein